MNIIQLYQDFSITYVLEGHKHSREGWVNTECPHCSGSFGYHLGYNIDNNYYVCWRCGWHPVINTISKLLNQSEKNVYHLLKQYGGTFSPIKKEKVTSCNKKVHQLPSGVTSLSNSHKKYLEKRNFDPDYLEHTWNLLSTTPTSTLDNKSYKHRIIIPIIWNEVQVSYQGRDITGKTDLRYKACPKDRELIHHKHILFGKQKKWKSTGICVEGAFDVFRFGVYSFATFGIKYTATQLRLIAKTFKRVPVIFDCEPQAKAQADTLISELKFRGVESFRVDISDDPGNMKQEEANYLIKQLL
jgi:hypothetical protein